MLTRWNDFGNLARFGARDDSPFDGLDALRREMNRLFYDFEFGAPDTAWSAGAWPRVTLEDTGPALVLRAEVPGVTEKDLELSVEAGTVTIKGKRSENAPEGYSVHRRERAAFEFARSFSLPTKIDPDNVQATLKHGVLNVTLSKAKEVQPRQISVKAS